jgi:hypothetical protein
LRFDNIHFGVLIFQRKDESLEESGASPIPASSPMVLQRAMRFKKHTSDEMGGSFPKVNLLISQAFASRQYPKNTL